MNKLTSISLVLSLILTSIGVACVTQTTIAQLVAILGQATSKIAEAENNPSLAAKISTDSAAASAAILNWQNGSPEQDAVEALNILEDDLNLIPVVGQDVLFIGLVDLAIGTVEAILSRLPASTRLQNKVVRRVVPPVKLPRFTNPADSFQDKWNSIVAKDKRLRGLELPEVSTTYTRGQHYEYQSIR